MLNVLSLFSEIGAFEKALERLNIEHKLVAYCEIDKYASKAYSLIHNVSESMNLKDVTKVDILDVEERVDLITYGFPCQDISLAGKGIGFRDSEGNLTRSGLFFEAARIIDDYKPKFAIAENVKALTMKKHKDDFETVLKTLDEIGYNNYYSVLNAKDYGISQNRERVFIISIRKDVDNGLFKFPKPFELELRLRDVLENEVDEKFYLSDKIQERLVITDPTFTKSVIGTTKPKCRTIEQRDLVYQENSVMGTLVATDYKQPKQILESRRIGGLFDTEKSKHQAGSIWDINGLSPTLDTMQGGYRQPCIPIKEATKKGYAEAEVGDSINFEQPNSKTRRGRVGKQVVQTLTTSCNQATVTTELKIRKLTPKECFRLMGFDDKDVDILIENKISNTQLYKQAGNSIVVNVLEEIFKELAKVYSEFKHF